MNQFVAICSDAVVRLNLVPNGVFVVMIIHRVAAGTLVFYEGIFEALPLHFIRNR